MKCCYWVIKTDLFCFRISLWIRSKMQMDNLLWHKESLAVTHLETCQILDQIICNVWLFIGFQASFVPNYVPIDIFVMVSSQLTKISIFVLISTKLLTLGREVVVVMLVHGGFSQSSTPRSMAAAGFAILYIFSGWFNSEHTEPHVNLLIAKKNELCVLFG